ncbi:hypothetical protein [Oerskovia merdavium]|uniref:Uncharacterized protein n=1 Tax=Oerskovia merdavium TaxID=2762227 RepID=A0ABR8U4R9_9CELL|nr:hypothetical protein [Oerskovia merdavium]MBD7982789.1 hypothetical protein [Oerskovia merdavium]
MRCAECKKRTEHLVRVAKFGGGSYNRPGRWYDRSICEDCLDDGLRFADTEIERIGREPNRFAGMSVSSLRRAKATLLARQRPNEPADGASRAP